MKAREEKRSFIRKIPGYRSGKAWKMAIASIFYFMLVMAIIGSFGENRDRETDVASNNEQQEPALQVELTLEEVADKMNARVGQLYRNQRTANNSTLNIFEIEKYGTDGYTLNTGKHLENVVVVRAAGILEEVRAFVDEVGYFTLIDSEGNEYSALTVWTQTGEYDETAQSAAPEIVLEADKDISGYSYLMVGGYDRSRNDGKRTTVFAIEE